MKRFLIYLAVGIPSILLASITPETPFNWDWFIGWTALAIASGITDAIKS